MSGIVILVKIMSSSQEKILLVGAQSPHQDFAVIGRQEIGHNYVTSMGLGLLTTTDDKRGREC